MKKVRKYFIRNVVFYIITLFLFFVFAELALRLVKFRVNQAEGYFRFGCFQWAADKFRVPIEGQDPCLFWRCQKGNEFREKFYQPVKGENTYRVICLGDSTTQGYMMQPMVIAHDQTYPYYLEKILNDRRTSLNFEVINAGCGGYSSFQGKRYLENELLRLDPDLLIVWFGANDMRYAISHRDSQQRIPDKTISGLDSLFSKSKFYQFYRQALLNIASNLKKDERRVTAKEFYENLNGMNDLAESRGIKILFIIPFSKQNSRIVTLEESEGVADYMNIFLDLKKEDIAVVDLGQFFKQEKDGASYFFDYCHANPQGNRLIANSVYAKLLESGIISIEKITKDRKHLTKTQTRD